MISVLGEGVMLYFSQFPRPAQSGEEFLRRKDRHRLTEWIEAKTRQIRSTELPFQAVIRKGIFGRPMKAQVKDVDQMTDSTMSDESS